MRKIEVKALSEGSVMVGKKVVYKDMDDQWKAVTELTEQEKEVLNEYLFKQHDTEFELKCKSDLQKLKALRESIYKGEYSESETLQLIEEASLDFEETYQTRIIASETLAFGTGYKIHGFSSTKSSTAIEAMIKYLEK